MSDAGRLVLPVDLKHEGVGGGIHVAVIGPHTRLPARGPDGDKLDA
jgi:hypothetical protein